MANPSTRITISANDQASPVIRRIGMEMAGLGQTAQSIGGMASMTGFGSGLMALANPITALTAGFLSLEASALRVDDTLRRTEKAFTVIYGSANIAAARMKEIRDEADRLGVSYLELADQAKKFDAAVAQSTLRGQGQKILSSFGGYGAVLGLDSQGMSVVYRAITQMVSKGKISAEELRQQLAEQLPGAVQLFAEALGVSEQQLDKMLERGEVGLNTLLKVAELLEKKFGGDLSKVTDNLTQNVARLGNAWDAFLQSIAATEAANWVVKGLRDDLQEMLGIVREFQLIWMTLRGEVPVAKTALGMSAKSATEHYDWLQTPEGLRSRISELETAKAFRFYTSDKKEIDRRIAELERQYREAVAAREAQNVGAPGSMEERWLNPRDKGMSEAASRARKAEDTRWEAEAKAQEKAEREAEQNAERLRNALQQITADLARMTDTGDGSASRLAALNKQLEDHAEKMGAAHPKVKEFADVIAYANKHLGYTPAEVDRATRAVEEQSDALRDRAKAMESATRSDGTVDQQKLSLLMALSAADRQYTKDILNGVEERTAAQRRELSQDEARRQKAEQDKAVVESFLSQLASMYTNDLALQKHALDKQVENYRAAGVAEVDLARWKARRELEIATDAWSGISRGLTNFYEENTNSARQWENFTTSTFGGIASAFQVTTDGMTVNWNNMLNNMLTSLLQMRINAAAGSAAGWLEGALSSFFSAGGGTGGTASGAWGSYADRVPGIAGVRAAGGPVEAGRAYLVGEKRPEVFVPGLSGAIIPKVAYMSTGAAQHDGGGHALGVSLKVELVNQSGVPLKASQQSMTFDGETYVCKMLLSGLSNNNSGITETFQNMRG